MKKNGVFKCCCDGKKMPLTSLEFVLGLNSDCVYNCTIVTLTFSVFFTLLSHCDPCNHDTDNIRLLRIVHMLRNVHSQASVLYVNQLVHSEFACIILSCVKKRVCSDAENNNI